MMVDAEIHQPVHMGPIPRAGVDGQIGEVRSHDLRDPERAFDIVDRQHEGARLVGAGGAKDVDAPRIPIVDLRAEALHEIDLLDIGVERRERDAAGAEHAGDDLPEPAEARDNDMLIAVRRHFVFRRLRLHRPVDGVVDEEEKRRRRHRQGHGEREEI